MRHQVNYNLLDDEAFDNHCTFDGCTVEVRWSSGPEIGNNVRRVHVPPEITMLYDAFDYALERVGEDWETPENLDFHNCELIELLTI